MGGWLGRKLVGLSSSGPGAAPISPEPHFPRSGRSSSSSAEPRGPRSARSNAPLLAPVVRNSDRIPTGYPSRITGSFAHGWRAQFMLLGYTPFRTYLSDTRTALESPNSPAQRRAQDLFRVSALAMGNGGRNKKDYTVNGSPEARQELGRRLALLEPLFRDLGAWIIGGYAKAGILDAMPDGSFPVADAKFRKTRGLLGRTSWTYSPPRPGIPQHHSERSPAPGKPGAGLRHHRSDQRSYCLRLAPGLTRSVTRDLVSNAPRNLGSVHPDHRAGHNPFPRPGPSVGAIRSGTRRPLHRCLRSHPVARRRRILRIRPKANRLTRAPQLEFPAPTA